MTAQTKIEWTRVRSDVNGNPRYVCHFLNLNTREEINQTGKDWIDVSTKYQIAVKRATKSVVGNFTINNMVAALFFNLIV